MWKSVVPGRIYFQGSNGVDGWEPFYTDGTDAGTGMLLDVNPEPPGPDAGDSLYTGGLSYGFTRFGALDYFQADDGVHGVELWVTDGTPVGTRLFLDINHRGDSYPMYFFQAGELGGRLFFGADDGAHGAELWVTDGTVAGTELFADLTPGGDSLPTFLGRAGGTLVLVAADASGTGRLWSLR